MDEQHTNLPRWVRRLREEREARGWSVADAARALRAHGGEHPISQQDAVRIWRRWERGDIEMPDEHNKHLIARTFGTVVAVFFPPPSRAAENAEIVAVTGMDTIELIARLRASDIPDSVIDGLEITVDRLSTDYSREPAEALRAESLQWLSRIVELRDRRLSGRQHMRVLSLAGHVALLVGCLEYDLGMSATAETTRQMALTLGEDSGDKDVVGWGWEMAAWYALTKGHYRAAVAATEAGLSAVGPSHSVVVQLHAHRAKAWARMRDRREVEVSLDSGRAVLERLPYPHNVANHFVVDPSKWDFYTQDCYRHVGEDDLARVYAEEVIQTGTDFDGTVLRPMRVAEAEITLGVVAARRGDLDAALESGRRALNLGRRSLPSLMMNARELAAVMRERFANAPQVGEFEEQLRSLAA